MHFQSFLSRFTILLTMVAVLLVVGVSVGAGDAYAKSKKTTKSRKAAHHSQPYNPKNASILIEANSGMVLAQDNADWTLYPASLTKLMTLLLTFDALDSGRLTLRSPVTVSAHAASMAPSKLGVRPGNSITVDQAIRAVVTKSANDIAVALAETVGGTESGFAGRMNLKAREIGMTKTHFVNATGLHNVQQYSSARDMAKLGQYIYKNKPRYYPYFALRQFYYGGNMNQNHNHLMSEYEGMDGMKTGYIVPSGFNLVASAKRNGVRLIGVVFGGKTASSRNAQMRELLDDGFERARRINFATAAMPQTGPQTKSATVAASTPSPRTVTATQVAPVATAPLTSPTPSPIIAPAAAPVPIPVVANVAKTEVKPEIKASVPVVGKTPAKVATPPVPTTPVPAPSLAVPPNLNTAATDWSIQIGSYQDRVATDQAIYRALQKLPAPLNHGNAIVMPLRTAEATWVFRARISNYSKAQAEAACRLLEHCLVISPAAR